MKKKTISHLILTNMINKSVLSLPTPSNISYMWNFGSLLGINLMIQMVSGILLSMHFCPESSISFQSTIHIQREVNMGFILRFLHANGASMFFILIFLHISRGLLFSSYKKKETWISGTFILLILMGTAFLGYVLPWGQMSFWGATVITNLISAIPFVGDEVVKWVWGGFSVSNATLNRFFSMHFLFPFIISGMVIIHILSLHSSGSSNPQGSFNNNDKIKFHPLFSWKDAVPPAIIMMILVTMCCMSPFILGDPENFNMANPMVTPTHIQPEWYFLFAYAILRSIPNKIGGVIALVMSILIIIILSGSKKIYTSCKFNPTKKMWFWSMSTSFIMLTWGGSQQIESPYELMSKIFSMTYFVSMIMIYFLN